jgi:hypothetical protein
MNETLLLIRNRHLAACGVPAAITGDNPDVYLGYYENALGEQWVFTYDRTAKRGELRGGDAGWDKTLHVRDGRVAGLVLNAGESAWLESCWQSAVGDRG